MPHGMDIEELTVTLNRTFTTSALCRFETLDDRELARRIWSSEAFDELVNSRVNGLVVLMFEEEIERIKKA